MSLLLISSVMRSGFKNLDQLSEIVARGVVSNDESFCSHYFFSLPLVFGLLFGP